MHWYQYSKLQIEAELKTDSEKGLVPKEAQRRLLNYGPNLLPEEPLENWFHIFARQFKSPLVYILLVCAIIIYALGEWADSLIILIVLLFNALVGTLQEGRSQSALKAIKKLSDAEATVLRAGEEEILAESLVVPGDILVLQEGQKVVADARLLRSSTLSCDEAPLTGESGAVRKNEAAISQADVPVASQKNMVFKGTNVLTGSGLAVVVGTGSNTEIGRISRAVSQASDEIPLQKNINRLSRLIIAVVAAISVCLFFLGLYFGRGVKEMFETVVSLAVSIIPEGLPLVLTLILVSGMWRMSKRRALVKRLQAVEALGQAEVIAVDKTGTITKNEMMIRKVLSGGRIYEITGNGYDAAGAAKFQGEVQKAGGDLSMLGKIAALASRGIAKYSLKEKVFKVSGDPTEAALAVLGEKLGQLREKLQDSMRETAETAFDYKNKFRAIFYEQGQEGVFCAIAGAPEALFERASAYLEEGQHREFTRQTKKLWEDAVSEFSEKGLRVVALGFKLLPKGHKLDGIDNLILAGLVGIEDVVRPQAKEAIKQIRAAGLKVVMITGDHKVTATAIAKEAGIYRENDEIITGPELAELMENGRLKALLPKVSVFARVTPQDKMTIVKAYKKAGLVIAMTGDGVNDAPSLVAADLGVAMGRIGTEVAKEAADLVLLDDNLGTIVSAIEEGRNMHNNIEKSLLFLFSTSLGELLTIVAALFLHLPIPLLAAQILWLNLVTDPLIGTALALDKKEPGLLPGGISRLPKYFINRKMFSQMLVVGVSMAAGTLYLFGLYQQADYSKAATLALTTLAVMQWLNGFNSRRPNSSIFDRGIFANYYLLYALAANFGLQCLAIYAPFMQKLLHTSPLSLQEWILVCALSFMVVLADELRKFFIMIWLGLKKFFRRKTVVHKAG